MAPPSNPSTDGHIAKRLHIGGLTNPKITHLDLEKRFSSFGKVEGVEGVGTDANGEFDARASSYRFFRDCELRSGICRLRATLRPILRSSQG